VGDHDPRFFEALRAGGADVILLEDRKHAGAGVAGQLGEVAEGEDEGRQHKMVEPVRDRKVFADGAHPARWQDVQADREEHDQHDAQPEDGDRRADEAEPRHGSIEQRVALQRRDDPQGDAQQDGDPDRRRRQDGGVGQPVGDDVGDGFDGVVGVAEVAPHGVAEPAAVLDDERIVQLELGGHLGDLFLGEVWVRQHGRAAGCPMDQVERDKADDEEQDDGLDGPA
jgi:hypothetical protein